jgi:DNA-binding YbaB/EbfC family protein
MKNQMNQLLQQAQAMQKKMMEMQQQLDTLEVEGQSGAGMVKVMLSGKSDMKRIKIDASLCDPNEIDMLEDLIVAAFNDARKKVEDAAAQQMASVTGGMQLPPGLKLF